MKLSENSYGFATDLHGNLDNLDLFLAHAAGHKCEYTFIGGDIAPKRFYIKTKGRDAFPVQHDVFEAAKICKQNPGVKMTERDAYGRGHIRVDEQDLTHEEFIEYIHIYEKLLRKYTDYFEQKEEIKRSGLLPARDACQPNFTPDEFLFLDRVFKKKFIRFFRNNETYKEKIRRAVEETGKYYFFWPDHIWMIIAATMLFEATYNTKAPMSSDIVKEIAAEYFPKSTDPVKTYHALSGSTVESEVAKRFLKAFLSTCNPDKIYDIRSEDEVAVAGQKKALKDIIARLRRFRKRTGSKIIAVLGNDDHPELMGQLRIAQSEGILTFLNSEVRQVDEKTQVLGYTGIPPIPGTIQWWHRSEDAIRDDLQKILMGIRKDARYTVFNIHSPPAGTSLSLAKIPLAAPVADWGSGALREAIEIVQPDLVLCGHIHESWKISGRTDDAINKSTVINPGASDINPRFVFGNLEQPGKYSIEH